MASDQKIQTVEKDVKAAAPEALSARSQEVASPQDSLNRDIIRMLQEDGPHALCGNRLGS